jgi:hypothetical protein
MTQRQIHALTVLAERDLDRAIRNQQSARRRVSARRSAA